MCAHLRWSELEADVLNKTKAEHTVSESVPKLRQKRKGVFLGVFVYV